VTTCWDPCGKPVGMLVQVPVGVGGGSAGPPGEPGKSVDGVRLEGSALIFSVGGVDLPAVDISGVCCGTVTPPPVESDEWLVGVGAPLASLGGPGRVYVDSVSGDVYLNGSPTRWFFGSGAPGVVAGAKPGAGYLDVLSGDFYEMGV